MKPATLALACAATLAAGAAFAVANSVSKTKRTDQTCIASNAVPDHATGTFPNRGNPHRMRAQNISYCFDSTPTRSARANYRVRVTGIALNGIPIRPGTADYYDPSTPRGFSRNRASGLNMEGIAPGNPFGLDQNNAHVDHRGLYHYHGIADALVTSTAGTQIGYAADGFEIHVHPAAVSSWQLKTSPRTSGPGGMPDGRFSQDFEYVSGSGTLDECNGAMLDGKYVYFATETYPYYPRCVWGTPGRDFVGR